MQIRSPLEKEIQAAYFSWVNLKAASDKRFEAIFSIPNGAWLAGNILQRSKIMAALKRQGLRPGLPDVFIACPHLPTQRHGFFIEFKRKSNVPSESQLFWHRLLDSMGFLVRVHTDWIEAAQETGDWIETSGASSRL